VSGKIFFAGECTATSGMGSGTVNGALETAVRAAAEVLRYFKPKSKL
jgi:monoamine oxidase